MGQKPLTISQLAKVLLPAFAVESQQEITVSENININKNNYKYAYVPTDLSPLIAKYLRCYKPTCEDINEINLIVDVNEYFTNPETWLYTITKKLSEEFNILNNPKSIDFESGYLYIKYYDYDLAFLKGLDPDTFEQLMHMCNWITGIKDSMITLNNYHPSPIIVKEYPYKRISL